MGWFSNWFALRRPVSTLGGVTLGAVCVLVFLAAWWALTRGETAETRLVGPMTLPSPHETFGQFGDLWRNFELTRNTLVTLRRVTVGFGLALLVGIPLGVAAGCFPRVQALLAPLVMLGRNIPLAAVVPLMLFVFGAGEKNKVMFIFFACVAFVISDTARAISDVAQRYVDTAYTLGANRWQTIMKVLVPLAAPTIFSSCRMMFGLAFGYIMLAESIKIADEDGGLGYQIYLFQKRGFREHIYLIILIIPVIALVVDQFLFWIQRQLFPHVYSGDGILNYALRKVLHLWDDLKSLVFGKSIESLESAGTVGANKPAESSESTKKVERANKP